MTKKALTKKKTTKKGATKRATKRTGKARTPPLTMYPAWSEAKFWAFLRSGLRAKWQRWPPRFEILKTAQRPYVLALDTNGNPVGNKRQKYEYQCAQCGNWFPQKEVSVDHIEPVGTLKAYSDLPGFVERLFVGVDKLQILCDNCHTAKTQEERHARESHSGSEG